MRITNLTIKKKSFFVRFISSLINLWFSTNQIEETNKQTKLRWWVVDHSHGDTISMKNSLELPITLARFCQQQQQQEQLLKQQQQQQQQQQ